MRRTTPLRLCCALLAAGAHHALTLDVGDVHIFVDADGLDPAGTANVSIALGAVTKAYQVAVTSELPWEEVLHFYTSMVTVPSSVSVTGTGQFYLYYSCTYKGALSMNLCFANSTDGVRWTKPLLPTFPWTDGSPTNIVFQVNTSSPGSWPGSVLLDCRPGVQPVERFKLTYEGEAMTRVMYVATSPDGLTWARRDPEVPVINVRLFSDTQTAIVWSPTRGTYTAYGRKDAAIANNATVGCAGNYPSLRRVMMSVSNDSALGNYSEPVQVLGPGFPDAFSCLDVYNPAPVQHGSTTLLLPSSFRHYATAESSHSSYSNDNFTSNDGVLDVRLAVSRDGASFSFVSRDAFLPRGVGYRDPTTGAFTAGDSDLDAGFVFATAGGLVDTDVLQLPALHSPFPFPLPSKRVGLLYWGGQRTHGGESAGAFQGVLRADMRREGYAALRSPPDDPVGAGSFRTLPLVVPSASTACSGQPGAQLWLLLNAQTSVAGQVTLALLQPGTLEPIPGYSPTMSVPFYGDSVRTPAGWAPGGNGTSPLLSRDLAPLAGQSVVVLVSLTHAQVFAWVLQCVQVAAAAAAPQ